jgi:Mrp family chromosome partitioning ATPase
MGIFGKKLRQMENSDGKEILNLAKATSDKAAEVIKELSGKQTSKGRKVVDNLIVFTNAAGGAGASTIAHNVAYTATKKGLKTILVDLNIMCPTQQAYLGIKHDKLESDDLVSYLLGKASLSDCIEKGHVVNLIYANNRTLSDEINCNEHVGVENFTIMLTKLRQYYDLVIVDCPMRVDSMLQNVMLYNADTIYTVWEEGIGSIINTERLRRNMALSGIDSFVKMKIILNKRTSIHFTEYPISKLNLELIETLPFDIDIIENSLKGRIFCEKGSSSSKNAIIFAQKIQSLTDKILKNGGYIE